MTDYEREEVDRRVSITSRAADELIAQNQRASRRLFALGIVALSILLVVQVTFGVINLDQQNSAHHRTASEITGLQHVVKVQSAGLKITQQQLRDTKTILRQVETVTSRQARANSAKETEQIINLVVRCIAVHSVQDEEAANHQRVRKLPKGCPRLPVYHPRRS